MFTLCVLIRICATRRHSSSADFDVRRQAPTRDRARLRTSARHPRAAERDSDSERSCVKMATQINVLDAGTDTVVSLLVVLMAILAMLGIVANVAMA